MMQGPEKQFALSDWHVKRMHTVSEPMYSEIVVMVEHNFGFQAECHEDAYFAHRWFRKSVCRGPARHALLKPPHHTTQRYEILTRSVNGPIVSI